ncbi:hypothetical protein GCM10027605_52160 [Micromonospora zhanjiangensis]
MCALADSTDQPAGSGTRPTDWAASTYSGTPCAAQAAAARSTGWTVPTSWLALIRAASATPGAATAADQAARSSRPSRSTGTGTAAPPASTCRRAACSTAECSIAECTSVAPARRRPANPPSTAACAAVVPLPVKESSSGRTRSTSAVAARAASSSWRARRARA